MRRYLLPLALPLLIMGFVCIANAADVAELKARAESGDVKAQGELALAYIQGEGVPADRSESLRWFRLAAEGGDLTSQQALGLMYKKGLGVNPDNVEALKWYGLAAKQGDLDSAIEAGWLLCMGGEGLPRDTARGKKMLEEAAKTGRGAAWFRLGALSELGIGGEVDLGQALELYKKAAESGHEESLGKVAEFYTFGKGVPEDIVKGSELSEKCAEAGNMHCQFNVGLLYYMGLGRDVSYGKAAQWFVRAANQGHAAAATNVGVIFYMAEQYDKAFWASRIGAEGGRAQAQMNLAIMYENGQGTEKNYVEGFKWATLGYLGGSGEIKDNCLKLVRFFAANMTPSEIEEAKRKVEAYEPTEHNDQ